ARSRSLWRKVTRTCAVNRAANHQRLALTIESEPPGAEAKTSLGQNCRTPCQFRVQPGSEFSVTLTLSGYQPQTVSVRPEADGAVAVPRLAPNPVHVEARRRRGA